MSKTLKLPLRWYDTFAAVAHDWGVHLDVVEYYAAAGLLNPAVVVKKSLLPRDVPGPGASVVVLLPDYRSMDWQGFGEDRAARLIGEYRGFEIDRQQCHNLVFSDCDEVLVSSRDLVVPLVERETIESAGQGPRPINPTERRTLLTIIGSLARSAYPTQVARPYTVAARVCDELSLRGIELSTPAAAQKLAEALRVPSLEAA